MFVVTVIPISRGIGKEVLTYFTTSLISIGSLVKVPLRKSTILALVIKIEDARTLKSELRSSDFTLKKIEKLESKPFLSEAFMQAITETATYHASTTGATLNVFLPEKILDELDTKSKRPSPAQAGIPRTLSHTVLAFQGTLEERFAYYQKQIEENKKVVIISPTKERQRKLKEIFLNVLIILPSSLLDIPLDTSLIIIEDEISRAYRRISRPFLDMRFTLIEFARNINANILLGGSLLRVDTIYKARNGLITLIANEPDQKKIERIVEDSKKKEDQKFSVLGENFKASLMSFVNAEDKPYRLAILATRKGHSGMVICQDCGTTVTCKRCKGILTLHLNKLNEEGNTEESNHNFNNLLCHHCGFKESALRTCDSCGSWKLKALGIGIEKIKEEVDSFLKSKNVKVSITVLESDTKSTDKNVRESVAKHYSHKRSILITTEISLPYLADEGSKHKNNGAVIPSLDSLLSIPDFGMNEKIMNMLTLLEETTTEKIILQTKSINHPLVLEWKGSELERFYDRELEERKVFNYPPCGVMIKISIIGKKDRVVNEMKIHEEKIKAWKPSLFPALIRNPDNRYTLNALINLDSSNWPSSELLSTLLSLPPSFIIRVNPDNLL